MEKWTVHMQWAGWTRCMVQEKSFVFDPGPLCGQQENLLSAFQACVPGKNATFNEERNARQKLGRKENGEAGQHRPTAGIVPAAKWKYTSAGFISAIKFHQSDERELLEYY